MSQISDYNSAKSDFGTELAISTRTELDPGNSRIILLYLISYVIDKFALHEHCKRTFLLCNNYNIVEL